jgi:hypothetical protein
MRGLILAALVAATAAIADGDIKPTYQATFDAIAARHDCKRRDYPDFILFDCSDSDDPQVWYFTKPGSPAHPGVLERHVTAQAIETNAHSYGPDDAQPAFEAWMESIARALMH